MNFKNITFYDNKDKLVMLDGEVLYISRRNSPQFAREYFDWRMNRAMG